ELRLMPFSDFHGNAETVHRLRDMLARDRFPHAVVLSGAPGSGKYTLALMLAQTLNCLAPTQTDGLPDFCAHCANCTRIAQPPDFATIFLLTENPGELLPTIRSRSMVFPLAALPAEEIESYLAKHHPEWKSQQRSLVARLCQGAVGRARSFDLATYVAARSNA